MSNLALNAHDQEDAFGNGNSDEDVDDVGGVIYDDEYAGLDSEKDEEDSEKDEDDELVAAGTIAATDGATSGTQQLSLRKQRNNTLDTTTRVREITDPAERTTRPYMTIYERAAVIGERATRIEQGEENIDPLVIAICKKYNITVALDIAEIELESIAVPCPMVVKRRISRGVADAHDRGNVMEVYEVWNVRELILPSQVLCRFSPPGRSAPKGVASKELCPSSVLRMIISKAARIAKETEIDISVEEEGGSSAE